MPSHYGGGKKKTGMKKTTKKKSTTKRAPPGFHRMPDGSLMKNGKHKGKK